MLLDLDLDFRGFWCPWIKLLVFSLLREGERGRGRGERERRGGRREERGREGGERREREG